MEDQDLIDAGFKRLDPSEIEKPPKIRWGELYKSWPMEKRLRYAEKVASSMNHAAHLIQKERNQLSELCAMKEKQIEKMLEAVRQNNEMLQTEVSKMNEQKQGYNKYIAELNAKIRELKNGTND